MKLADYLNLHRISRDEFARKIGSSQAAVSRYVTGRRMPRSEQLRRIAELTNGAVTANDFVGIEQRSEAA